VRAGLRRVASHLLQRAWHLASELGRADHRSALAKEFGSFGEGSFIGFPPGTIFNAHAIHVGAATMIAPYVTLTAGMLPGQPLLSDRILEIGDGCIIGHGSHVIAHYRITISDHVITGPYVYITDQNHGYADPTRPIRAQDPVDQPVFIGSGTWIGTKAIVLPGSYIGANCVVAAGAVVRGVVPDRSVVAGVPAKVVKVFDPEEGWSRPPACDGVDPAGVRGT
jgi:carbonic anhydrase/acetyltransferase-like protein (isoleucine patch superfamily)